MSDDLEIAKAVGVYVDCATDDVWLPWYREYWFEIVVWGLAIFALGLVVGGR